MEYLLSPYADSSPPFAYWENGFEEKELDRLQEMAKNVKQSAAIGDAKSAVIDKQKRRASVEFIGCNEETNWIYEKLSEIVGEINAEYFRFDLNGFGEALQLTNYDESQQGMYGWHQDFGSKISRKLSVVLQLSDPSEYEGGNLQIMGNGSPVTIKKSRGFVVIFPAYTLHQVTPVVKGSRQSLVTWVSGPQFK